MIVVRNPMHDYGFQRLVLLNCAGYERAELPLDDSVSLVAPNNAGKTSLINALQFLLIIDQRRMDFGPHDADASRKFYFRGNSSYILLEVLLPDTGLVVMGCVGKGVSHDYTYFVYQGQLDVADFRQEDGTLVQEPRLNAHFENRGRVVHRYETAEFTAMLYGGLAGKRASSGLDCTVFRLEDSLQAATFQKVLTRTLRLDKLRSAEVKGYLLEIFKRDLPDHDIDFKAEWERAFAEVNADRAQYLAARRLEPTIAKLETMHLRRRELRGRIGHDRPLMDAKLRDWQTFYEQHLEALQAALQREEARSRELEERRDVWILEKNGLERQQGEEAAQDAEQQGLERRFTLVPGRETLEATYQALKQRYEQQVALVQQADHSSPDALERQIEKTRREVTSLERQLANLGENLYLTLGRSLPADVLDRLNRVLHRDVMALPPTQFSLDPTAVEALSEDGNTPDLTLAGICVDTTDLQPQFSQRSEADLRAELREQVGHLEQMRTRLQAASDLQPAKVKKERLEGELRALEQELGDFDRLQVLRADAEPRRERLAGIREKIAELAASLTHIDETRGQYRAAEKAQQQAIVALQEQHQVIERLRNERADRHSSFDYLEDLPHVPWAGRQDFALQDLAGELREYQEGCRELLRLDQSCVDTRREIHAGGLIKFSGEESHEAEMVRIIEFARHLPQEAEALARKERSAIINVTASLRLLRGGLHSFKSRMREFNRIISGRQLSDLKVFKIEPYNDEPLVGAVDLLIGTAESADTGDTFELFNQQSLVDNVAVSRARDILIQAGETFGCLRVENLFRLEFVVRKAGREEESFGDIDSAASNGTVLMAKLVTGLALLHLMKDQRHQVRAVCYLDEASSLDQRNQRNLIETARDFGFALIFASPTPQVTARYCVPITSRDGINRISAQSWCVLEPLTDVSEAAAG
jgi:hypothetical protein